MSEGSNHERFQHDEEAFRKKIPYPLVATSLPGVYVTAPPPEDLSTASASDFVRHGLFWPGLLWPGLNEKVKVDGPSLEAMRRLFSRIWIPKNRIVPEFGKPRVGKTPRFGGPHPKGGISPDGLIYSTNWSGVVISSPDHSWSYNGGVWKIPTVSGPTAGGVLLSSSFVGIDGGSKISNDVLAAGIDQNYDGLHKDATYSPFYQWWSPQAPIAYPFMNVLVNPGDEMICWVAYMSNMAGFFFVGNLSTGIHFSHTVAPPTDASFLGNTIEWIMSTTDPTALPKFSPVNFSVARGAGYRVLPDNLGTLVNWGYPLTGDILEIQKTSNDPILTSVSVGLESLTINFTG